MIRVLMPAILLLIIGVFGLIYLRSTRKQTVRKRELEKAVAQERWARRALSSVMSEIDTQLTAGYTDLFVLQTIVQDHLDDIEESDRKEIKL